MGQDPRPVRPRGHQHPPAQPRVRRHLRVRQAARRRFRTRPQDPTEQGTDANGQVTFDTIFPAAYSGRWPHMHFEVYASLSDATAAGQIVKTSQPALPQDACESVYATSGYEQSVRNLAQTSLQRDMVFGDDGGIYQIGAVTGSVSGGYAVSLTVPV